MQIINNYHPIFAKQNNFKGSLMDYLSKPAVQPSGEVQPVQNAPAAAVTAAYMKVDAPELEKLRKIGAGNLLLAMTTAASKANAAVASAKVEEPKTEKLEGYKNNLRSMFQNNQVVIYAMVPRIFNAKDKNGNRLIEEGEEKGTFLNMIDRLDELKSYGINTLHWLPINPPGTIAAKGSAGSVYAPLDYLTIDPALDDPNNPKSVKEECKEAINECHKRGIKVMIDLPSCMSVDLYDARPDLRAEDASGNPKTPEGWEDIRMFEPWADQDKRILNPALMKYHKDFIDMCIDLGIDGIRADVARAKPVEFWDELITYTRRKDPEFAFLAESYTYEDASPIKNMPADRPEELLEAGFDSYYGQYHIFPSWNSEEFHQFVKDNLKMSEKYDKGKSLIGSFATHDDKSPMSNGGPDYCMMTSAIQATLPMTNPYIVTGFETGDDYIYPYGKKYVDKTFNELMKNPVYKDTVDSLLQSESYSKNINLPRLLNSEDANLKISELAKKPEYKKLVNYFTNFMLTKDNIKHYVHPEFLDIFNESAKPEGKHPEIGRHFAQLMNVFRKQYENVITKGSYIELKVDGNKRKDIIAYARHYQGKTLVVIANKDVNSRERVTVKVPGLKSTQVLKDLSPEYGNPSRYQAQDGAIRLELGAARAHIFEVDTPDIEKAFKPSEVYRQNL